MLNDENHDLKIIVKKMELKMLIIAQKEKCTSCYLVKQTNNNTVNTSYSTPNLLKKII